MANTHAHAMASFGSPVGFGGLISSFSTRITARRAQIAQRARIRRELESYTDRQLGDLGLSRLDIAAVAAGHYGR